MLKILAIWSKKLSFEGYPMKFMGRDIGILVALRLIFTILALFWIFAF